MNNPVLQTRKNSCVMRAFVLFCSESKKWYLMVFAMLCMALPGSSVLAAKISDIRGTKHNLSAVADETSLPSGGTVPIRTVKATSESQVCVFCHTPHGASAQVMPLWNRKFSDATYAPYTSSSLDADVIQASLRDPAGSSKLCLSCHDGTLAIGGVNVLNGAGGQSPGGVMIEMAGTASGVMPSGSGTDTGYTRNLGVDLTNDHPISVDYTTALSSRDGELRAVDINQKYPAGTGEIIGIRDAGHWPKAALEPTGNSGVGQIQCATCHDPHLRETDEATNGNQKFLRLNRFQTASPITTYNSANDINCVACHDKDNGVGAWTYSVHANSNVATQTYKNGTAARNEFPLDLPVWKASCLNCHDTHSVQGSRWLLREGVSNGASSDPNFNPSTSIKAGGTSAIEEACYQCHTSSGNSAVTGNPVQDIKADFELSRHMPIKSYEQAANAEVHDIGGNFDDSGMNVTGPINCTNSTNKCGADFVENRTKLGVGNLNNRHAECSDCHNPHRVQKTRSAMTVPGTTSENAGTHDATTGLNRDHDATDYIHTNIASGVLRGTFGVEPSSYGSHSFNDPSLLTTYTVKRGDPGMSTATSVTETYVTREYQICLKCHSDYGYSDNNGVEALSDRPALGTSAGLTQAGKNGLYYYTNQAKEFQAPTSHKGETSGLVTLNVGIDGGAGSAYNNNNHRSWHPVMDATGRTPALRGGMNAAAFNAPWGNIVAGIDAVGNQTMYCSDCHGVKVNSSVSVAPDGGEINGSTSWGPHGSSNDFILKGMWDNATGDGQSDGLCFKCHDYASYAQGVGGGGKATGFGIDPAGGDTGAGTDGHQLHVDRIALTQPGKKVRCNWCHVAVPHGWKNKALLVNLNDVGAEAGLGGVEVNGGSAAGYNAPPYYLNARLKVVNFKPSGKWTAADCGSSGQNGGNGLTGLNWMKTGTETCQTPP